MTHEIIQMSNGDRVAVPRKPETAKERTERIAFEAWLDNEE